MLRQKLDYCNSLLGNVSSRNLGRLQRIQNACARLIMRKSKFDHITPLLRELHWLPIDKRIKFKIMLLTYKCINGLAPSYLSDLLHHHQINRTLRSNTQHLLVIPPTKLKTFGDRAFSIIAPTLWNSLPINIKMAPTTAVFKKHLKTFLF